jgi:hypothetical protein
MVTALIMLVASFVISAAFAPKQQPPAPTAFEDIDFPQADEGTPQAVIFGDCWSGDWTVLAVGNYRTSPVHADGGK